MVRNLRNLVYREAAVTFQSIKFKDIFTQYFRENLLQISRTKLLITVSDKLIGTFRD